MLHFVASQWTLPGPTSAYQIVWWHDEAAKDTTRQVPPSVVLRQIDKWLTSRRRTIEDLDEALGGRTPRSLSATGRQEHSEQIRKRISEAFRTGRLVALESPGKGTREQDASFAREEEQSGSSNSRGLRSATSKFAQWKRSLRQGLNDKLVNPRYVVSRIELPPMPEGFTALSMEISLEATIKEGKITSQDVKGADPVDEEANALLRYLLFYLGRQEDWNTFLKIRAEIKGNTSASYWAKVTIGAAGEATAELLSKAPPSKPARIARAEAVKLLKDTYKVEVGVVDGNQPWTDAELGEVVAALALLPQEDKGMLRGMDLIRVKALPKNAKGLFRTGDKHDPETPWSKSLTWIKFDDGAFQKASNFFGDARNPQSLSCQTILHEIGHAVFLRALTRPYKKPPHVARFVSMVKEHKIEPFTKYARDHWPAEPEEFCAEAYSLWILEPAFLEQYYPAVYEFFQKGKYRG